MSASTGRREPDAQEIANFVRALFPYADEGSFVSLRSFWQLQEGPPPYIRGSEINGAGLDTIIDEAVAGARFAANWREPLVFAPPIATFRCEQKAAEADLVNCVCLSVEIDEGNTTEKRKFLEHLLGTATCVVASGGEWADPTTGELFPKLHLHWRLSEPTRETEEHATLKHARRLACALVKADPTATTSVHPLRWPGSWHLKGAPKLASIVHLDAKAEVHLHEAVDALEDAAEQSGLNGDAAIPQSNGEPQAPIALVRSALGALPNSDEHWDQWIKIGLATYAATAGSADGLEAWKSWSQKSSKYVATACDERWKHFVASPPSKIGFGTIAFWAKQAGWERPEPEPEQETKEPQPRQQLPAFFDPWADPPPAEFPGSVLSREMEDTIFSTALRNGFCPGVLAMAYLAAASGASSKASRFAPYTNSTWWVPPIVWVMPIADSGQRKTAIEDIAFEALRNVHGEVWRQHREALRSWKAIPPKERLTVPKPNEPHSFIVEDTGVEKLQVILSETDRGSAMVRDEIAGLLEFGRYTSGKGSAERAYYLQAYEAGTYTVSRIGRDSIHIAVNGITLYGAIQPDRLKDFKDLDKDGLLQRINMLRASPATSSRDDIITKGADKIYGKIEALTRIEGQKYTTTPEGSALIRETEKLGQKLASIPDLGVGFQGTCSKLHGTHARYALVLHLLDAPTDPIVPTATVDRAGILIREFLLPQARDFFRSLTGAPQQRLRNIAGWILTKAPKRFLASDVTTGVWQCRGLGTKEIGEALDPLVSGGWLEPETPFPSNRSWTLHPKVREAFTERTETERARCEDVRQTFSQIGRKT